MPKMNVSMLITADIFLLPCSPSAFIDGATIQPQTAVRTYSVSNRICTWLTSVTVDGNRSQKFWYA